MGLIDMRSAANVDNVVSPECKAAVCFTKQDIETLELSPSQLLTSVQRLDQAGTRGQLK